MRSIFVTALAIALAACGGNGAVSNDNDTRAASIKNVPPPTGKQWSEVVVKTAQGFRMGNPQAPLKLVEYGSRTCPACGAFGREAMQPLERTYVATGRLSYEFREFMVHGPPDLAASLLGICVGTDPFFVVLEQMYQNQASYLEKQQAAMNDPAFLEATRDKEPGVVATLWAEKMGLVDFVKQRGVPEAKARTCLSDPVAIAGLTKITGDASDSGLATGTPTFILNDAPMPGVTSWSQLEPLIRNAGAR